MFGFVSKKKYGELEDRVKRLESRPAREGADVIWARVYLCHKCGALDREERDYCGNCNAPRLIEKTKACNVQCKMWYDFALAAGERTCLCGFSVIGFDQRPRRA